MFNSVLRALMQTFFMNCILMWTNLRELKTDSNEDKVDFCLAIAILLFAIAFPVCTFRFLRRKKESIKNSDVKMKYDSLYQNLDYYKSKSLAYTSLFLVRRLLFAFVIVFCQLSIVL